MNNRRPICAYARQGLTPELLRDLGLPCADGEPVERWVPALRRLLGWAPEPLRVIEGGRDAPDGALGNR